MREQKTNQFSNSKKHIIFLALIVIAVVVVTVFLGISRLPTENINRSSTKVNTYQFEGESIKLSTTEFNTIQNGGFIRLIVSVETTGSDKQELTFADSKSEIVASLGSENYQDYRDYRELPSFAISVNRAGLVKLLTNKKVTNISRNAVSFPN